MADFGGKTFLDSGTTYAYFGRELYAKMAATFASFCAKKDSNCGGKKKFQTCYFFDPKRFKKGLEKFLEGFPILSFEFNGSGMVHWYPEDYLVEKVTGKGRYFCPGVKKLGHTILGATFMRNYDIYFDKLAKKITFSRANCENRPDFMLREEKNNRRLKIYSTLTGTPPQFPTTVSTDGMISFTQSAALPGTVDKNSSVTFPNVKVKPDFQEAGQVIGAANATNTTQHAATPTSTFLFYYVIVFVFLVIFLIILMLRFMM